MRRSERMAIASTVICLGLLFMSLYSLPTWSLPLRALGRERPISIPGDSLMVMLMLAITCMGIHATLPADPLRSRHSVFRSASYWALPVLFALAAIPVIPEIGRWGLRVGAIAFTGGTLTLLAYVQVMSIEGKPVARRVARLVLDILAYVALWAASSSLLDASWNAKLRLVMMAVASWGLALCLLRDTGVRLRRFWLYAAIIAVAMSELALGLTALGAHPRLGGLALLVCFYCLVGISRQALLAQMDRRAIIEYFLVATAGIILPWVLSR